MWIVIDIKTEEVLAFRLSQGATIIGAVFVLKEALKYCKGKPRVFTDDTVSMAVENYGKVNLCVLTFFC